MLTNGWIKLYRQLLNWEWYLDIPTKVLYIHLLLCANIEDVEWHGIVIKRGSLVSSRRQLATHSGLTERQTRTALKHLEMTHEVTQQSCANFTVYTLNNYDKFQISDPQNANERPANRPAKRPQVTHESDANRPQYKNKEIRNKEERNKGSLATQDIDHDNMDRYDPNYDFGYIPEGKDF